MDRNGDQPDPDPEWRFVHVLHHERDFIPNLETALMNRTARAEKNIMPSGLPVYRVPISEMENFDEWWHVTPPQGQKQTLERRFVKLHVDAYQRSLVFALYDIFHYMYRDKPWRKLGGSGKKKAGASAETQNVAKSSRRRRRRKSS